MKKFLFTIFVVSLLFPAKIVFGVSIGDSVNFFVDSLYDISTRTEVTARLVKITPKLYFYIDQNWWDNQAEVKKGDLLQKLDALAQEFESKIYPDLTSIFGSEWKPGVDGDERISLLFHPMREDAGGYFRSADGYLRVQAPESNEKEMIYLNVSNIENPQLKSFVAHEFVHLITLNQKERIRNVSDEVWLNEARAEYSSTILGYDKDYSGSNLERRVKIFLENPSDSLTEWRNRKYDYGVSNLFLQYLVDHYGIEILASSLKSDKVGIPSIDEALQKTGFQERFSDIFTDWTIAVLLNDCAIGRKYCYLNANLASLRIAPAVNFLPLTGKSSLAVTDLTKNWSGNWQKFIGGNGVLKLKFEATKGLKFKVPYIIEISDGQYKADFMELGEEQKGEILIPDFGSKNKSLIIIPSLQLKTSGFDGVEPTYPFTFAVSTEEKGQDAEEKLRQELLLKIEFLQKEIARLKAEIEAISKRNMVSCRQIENNLYFGDSNSQVKCLQEFLKSQGPDIYPEGKITGYFGFLTKNAVVRFQEKYKSEVLAPAGLSKGTGVVGPLTRAKINQLLAR